MNLHCSELWCGEAPSPSCWASHHTLWYATTACRPYRPPWCWANTSQAHLGTTASPQRVLPVSRYVRTTRRSILMTPRLLVNFGSSGTIVHCNMALYWNNLLTTRPVSSVELWFHIHVYALTESFNDAWSMLNILTVTRRCLTIQKLWLKAPEDY